MADTGIKELLQAGVHFGHQTRRWDPAMRRYIHGERDGIHIIDLLQTETLLQEARDFCSEIAGRGGKVLFVGTKKQARDPIEEWAEKTGMPYVSRRWLGGLLTNFQTISKRIKRLDELDTLAKDGQLALLPTKERMAREAELRKLEFNLGGVRDMDRTPDAVFVIDLNAEEIAVNEARRLDLPIVALVDTNCDPRPVEYVIPGNDDAIRSCEMVTRTLGEAILESATAFQALNEAGGDPEKAVEILRVKGQASAAKRSGRSTSEGVVSSYIHANGKIGVLVEVQCETDFVARNDDFTGFAREIALHVAAAAPRYVSADEIPEDEVQAERTVFEQKAAEEGKPENVRDRIVEGQLTKWRKEVALLDQVHVNADKYEGKTIEQLREEAAARTGENIRIARFARFVVGEEG
jgi:small subunit ribosomal protein S2